MLFIILPLRTVDRGSEEFGEPDGLQMRQAITLADYALRTCSEPPSPSALDGLPRASYVQRLERVEIGELAGAGGQKLRGRLGVAPSKFGRQGAFLAVIVTFVHPASCGRPLDTVLPAASSPSSFAADVAWHCPSRGRQKVAGRGPALSGRRRAANGERPAACEGKARRARRLCGVRTGHRDCLLSARALNGGPAPAA